MLLTTDVQLGCLAVCKVLHCPCAYFTACSCGV